MEKDIYDWFRDYFRAHGKTPCDEVIDAAKVAGYSKSAIHDAKLTLQVQSTSVVYWDMPKDQL